MLTEENPEAFPSPEPKPEDASKKNKKPKKKKKNTENPAQPNQHPQPQVSSEPLVVVAPNPEIKSNGESPLPKKKKPRKKKNVINAEVTQPTREEPKPSLDLEYRKEAEPVEVSLEGAETVIGRRNQQNEIGKLNEVVIVENALKRDHAQEKLDTIGTEEKTGKKRKRKKNKSKLDGSQSNEPGETAVRTVDGSQSNEPGKTAVRTLDGSQSNEPGETAVRTVNGSQSNEPGETAVRTVNGSQSNEPGVAQTVDGSKSNEPGETVVPTLDGLQSNVPGETAVRTSIIDREVPLVEPTIPGNTRPVNLSELENEYLDRKWKQRKRKSEFLEKTKARNDKAIEIHVQRPVDPITEPSTEPAVVMDPHPATPVDTEQKISKKRKKKKRKCESEIPAQKSVISTTVPSTVSVDQAISIDPACRTAAPPIDAAIPEQKTSKKKRKRKGGLKSNALESVNAGSTAETSVRRTKRVKVTNAPRYQHGISSMICWACRETNHTIQQCQKLKHLSMDEEICFFCGEIGHSLGKCSVYKAGGGRLARCLFCNAHGHFSYNCPGNRHDPQVQLPVEAEKSSAEVTTVTEEMKEKSSAEVTTVTEGMKEKSRAEVTTVTEGMKLSI